MITLKTLVSMTIVTKYIALALLNFARIIKNITFFFSLGKERKEEITTINQN